MSFWEFTKWSALEATAEFFAPLITPRMRLTKNRAHQSEKRADVGAGRGIREDLAHGTREENDEYLRPRGRGTAEQATGQDVDKGREQVNQYIGRGREIVARGRAQWEDFVERGQNIVQEQTSRVNDTVNERHFPAAPRQSPERAVEQGQSDVASDKD